MSFSERYGYIPVENVFQREYVSDELRTKIWNILKISIWDLHGKDYEDSDKINLLIKKLWINFFNKDLDSLRVNFQNRGSGSYDQVKEYFFDCEWNKVYDFLEFLREDNLFNDEVADWVNSILESFNSAYRFVDNSIVEITNKNEIQSIEDALSHPEKSVREHLNSALSKLSDRDNSDYRNSIKESISAVEAACRILTANKSATLSDALKKVNNLHPAMKQAFDKLYGYTSDASGVRHSLLDEASITYADAKFMLVTCSAFVSYLNTNLSKP